MDIPTTYRTPCGPAVRSITGVEVTPISGVTWVQLCVSLGVSPLASSDTCQIGVPASASMAYTEACSVATKATLCAVPEIGTCARYNGCASTLPSTITVWRSPKLVELTLANVSVDSDRVCPLRATSFLNVATSLGDVAVTVSAALALVTLPAEFLTTTANVAPVSETDSAGVV